MREVISIIDQYHFLKSKDVPCVLATVVHVAGSSYRRAGARMLVDEEGHMTGAISGGCLEGDALQKALHSLVQVKNKLVTYDTSDEDDAVIGVQLGCNGVIQVLFEPIDYKKPLNPIELLKQACENDQEAIVVTRFNLQKTKDQPGTQLLLTHEHHLIGTIPEDEVLQQIKIDAAAVSETKASVFRQYKKANEDQFLFIEYFSPPVTLVLVGAGNDTQLLAQQAEILGWSIIIADGRPSHASPDRFSNSCRVIVTPPESLLDAIQTNNRTAFVLMTHNYQYDLKVLKLLLKHPFATYIGMLGPRKKYDRMLDELNSEGIELSKSQQDKIYAPIGLEIGAESPAEIGLSILAEIQAVFTKTKGSFLKDKPGPIHQKKNSQFEIVELLKP